MNQYYYQLPIRNEEALRKSWVDAHDFDKDGHIMGAAVKDYETVLNTDFLRKIETISKLRCILMFHNNFGPNYDAKNAHIDVRHVLPNGTYTCTMFALNFVIDKGQTRKGTMGWWSVKEEAKSKPMSYTQLNTPYLNYNVDTELIKEDELSIHEFGTLVRTDVPHSIQTGDGTRFCVSIRFADTVGLETWEKVIDKFSSVFNQ